MYIVGKSENIDNPRKKINTKNQMEILELKTFIIIKIKISPDGPNHKTKVTGERNKMIKDRLMKIICFEQF